MEFNEFYKSEPMKYWMPPKERHIELDIIEHPDKYSNYIGAEKKDGEWSRVMKNNGVVIIQSRSVSKVTGEYGRKEQNLPQLVELFKNLPDHTVLLGELYFEDLSKHSKDVGSILRCLKDKAISRQKDNPLHFYCFDVLMFNGEDLTSKGYAERIIYFPLVKNAIGDDKLVQYANIKTVDEIVKNYDGYLAAGGEGYVLYKKTMKYVPGKRTAWETIKLKKATDEIELPVVDILWPTRIYTGKELDSWEYYEDDTPVTRRYALGMANGIIVNNNGTLVSVTSGTTDEDATWLATPEAAEMINNGQLYAKVQAMEIEQGSGSMRHPSLVELRTDL